jgi:hypothetical protein
MVLVERREAWSASSIGRCVMRFVVVLLVVVALLIGAAVTALARVVAWWWRRRRRVAAAPAGQAAPAGLPGGLRRPVNVREVTVASLARHNDEAIVETREVDRAGRRLVLVGRWPAAEDVARVLDWQLLRTPVLLYTDPSGAASVHGPASALTGFRLDRRPAARLDPARAVRERRTPSPARRGVGQLASPPRRTASGLLDSR